ncbi:FAD-dependent oxidoreductase [Bacteriovoracaceae bacterium]|nr:FAD-dependent oxidoreductase [Bacteriovoracaceae bacterium]
MRIAIIGDGIAARSLLYNLSLLKSEVIEVHQFSSSKISSCSRNSTAVVAKRATQKGISELGNLIVDAYNEFESFLENFSGAGVDTTSEYIIGKSLESYQKKIKPRYAAVYEEESGDELIELCINHKQKFFKEKAYLIEPDIFLDSLKSIYEKKLSVKQVEDKIIGQDNLTLQGGKSTYGSFDNIIYCMGSIPQFVVEEKSQPVAGSFWQVNQENEKSFSLNCDGHHFMQKKNCSLFGSTSNANSVSMNQDEVEKIISQLSPLVQQEYLIAEGEFKTGIRYKGKKRMPKIGEIGPNTFCIANLYKNGWSLAFLAAKKISRQLKV